MTWFDLVHYTLVGFGVCFALLLIMLACQGITKLIVQAYGNRNSTEAHHTHTSEEHHIHHTRNIHHYEYDDEIVARPKTVRASKVPPIEYQRIEQTVAKPQMITRDRRS
jgi:hypothetical protein